MKIFSAVTKGAVKSAKSYSLAITAWLITLIMIWSASLILRAGFNSLLGKSMISDSLLGGFDVSILGDLGYRIAPFISSLTLTTVFLLVFGVILSVFFAGGFFGKFTCEGSDFRISDFFKTSARFFFPYLGVVTAVAVMIIFWGGIVFGLPLILTDTASRGTALMRILMKILGVIFILGLPVLLLVSDNARTWMAVTGIRKMFRAIGTGFKTTFKKFLRNYVSVFIVMITSIVLTLLILCLLKNSVPEKGIMIFLFFLLTQVIALLKVWVRVWRYATVTELVAEKNQY
jgi:hypothetical protein